MIDFYFRAGACRIPCQVFESLDEDYQKDCQCDAYDAEAVLGFDMACQVCYTSAEVPSPPVRCNFICHPAMLIPGASSSLASNMASKRCIAGSC
jgi:hypothetical protein